MFNNIQGYLEKVIFSKIFIIFSFIVLLKPLLLHYYPSINRCFNFAMIIVGIIIIIYYGLTIYQTRKISKLQFAILIYILSLAISTALFSHDYGTLFRLYGRWLIVSIYTEILIKHNSQLFLRILSLICYVLIIGQTISIILFPNGILLPAHDMPVYFLGNDNSTTITMTLGVLLIAYYEIAIKKKITLYSLFVVLLVNLSFLITWSATGIIATIMMDIFIIILHRKIQLPKYFNLKSYIIFALAIFILIVVLRFQNVFSFFIEGILHKNLSFTGRIYIWDKCFYFIKLHPIFGMGVWEFAVRKMNGIGIFHAHCTLLNILLEGGFVGLLAYLNIFRVLWRKIKATHTNTLINIASFSVLIYLTAGLVEVYHDSQMLYIFLALCFFHACNLTQNRKKVKKDTPDSYIYFNRPHRSNAIKPHKTPKVLVVINGGLPVPAINGGAVETLTELYLKANEDDKKYNFVVYSPYASNITKKHTSKYKHANFRYIKTNTLSYKIQRYTRAIINNVFHIRVSRAFAQAVLKDIKHRNEDNEYNLIIIENDALIVPPFAKNSTKKSYSIRTTIFARQITNKQYKPTRNLH